MSGRHGRKRVLAKCEKGSLLRGVERFERAIGRMHCRRLLCVGWQNERLVVWAFCRGVQLNALTTPLQYRPNNKFVSTAVSPHLAGTLSAGRAAGPFPIGHGFVSPLTAFGRKNPVHGPKGMTGRAADDGRLPS